MLSCYWGTNCGPGFWSSYITLCSLVSYSALFFIIIYFIFKKSYQLIILMFTFIKTSHVFGKFVTLQYYFGLILNNDIIWIIWPINHWYQRLLCVSLKLSWVYMSLYCTCGPMSELCPVKKLLPTCHYWRRIATRNWVALITCTLLHACLPTPTNVQKIPRTQDRGSQQIEGEKDVANEHLAKLYFIKVHCTFIVVWTLGASGSIIKGPLSLIQLLLIKYICRCRQLSQLV